MNETRQIAFNDRGGCPVEATDERKTTDRNIIEKPS